MAALQCRSGRRHAAWQCREQGGAMLTFVRSAREPSSAAAAWKRSDACRLKLASVATRCGPSRCVSCGSVATRCGPSGCVSCAWLVAGSRWTALSIMRLNRHRQSRCLLTPHPSNVNQKSQNITMACIYNPSASACTHARPQGRHARPITWPSWPPGRLGEAQLARLQACWQRPPLHGTLPLSPCAILPARPAVHPGTGMQHALGYGT